MSKVGVIGLGPLGLMAMKNLREEGFDVTGFDCRTSVGGTWTASKDSATAAHSTTTFNNSIYTSGFTDYPFPDDAREYPKQADLARYFQDYCDHFDLGSRARLGNSIINVRSVGSRWELEIKHLDGTETTECFDKVAFATGTFVKPKLPEIENIVLFQGRVLHAVEYHSSDDFKGQNVLVIGAAQSGADITLSLADAAKKIFLSRKHGMIFLSRYMSDGSPLDTLFSLRNLFLQGLITFWFPNLWNKIFSGALLKISKQQYPDFPDDWGQPSQEKLPPIPKQIVLADDLYPVLSSDRAEPVRQVSKIVGPKSIELKDGRILADIDAIIYCTGYDTDVPSAPEEYNPYPIIGKPPRLYRYVFPLSPDDEIRNSLAFLGHHVLGIPGFGPRELVSMSLVQIWKGNAKLPPLNEMMRWHEKTTKWHQGLEERHGTLVPVNLVPLWDELSWLDETAGTGVFLHFGWFQWRSWWLWWTDNELYKMCWNGVLTPALWRLFNMGKRRTWSGARQQIIADNERARKSKDRRLEQWKLKEDDIKKSK